MNGERESGGRRLWRLIYPFLTYMGISIAVGVAVSVIISTRVMAEFSGQTADITLEGMMTEILNRYYARYLEIQLVSVLIAIPVMLLYLRRSSQRRLAAGYVEQLPDRSPLWMAVAVVFGAVTAYAGNGMVALSGLAQVSDSYDEVAAMFYQGRLWLEILCLGILTPVVEEIIFRGLMYTQLTEFMSRRSAVLIGALLFAAYHGNLLQAIYAFCLALLMIYVYDRFHTLLAPICFHVGANVFGVLLSETDILSFLYRTRGAMYVSVTLFSLLVIGIVWLIENRQRLKN